ncbi:hypothetical protein HK105_200909 [Polyrhizophydium stewartii]|uniref:Metallo-beta-lactamase domain-containing protein n=1 Tax=Polyrhizophydium stewartii TaxID=2732419 RepID=A0ABR4NIB3_9FUNG
MAARLVLARRAHGSLAVHNLTQTVARISSPPAGPFSTQDSHAYLLGSGRERILIDTGTGHDDFIAALKAHLDAEDAQLSAVLLTHAHGNHANGLIRILQRFDAAKFKVAKVQSGGDKHGEQRIDFLADGQPVSTPDKSVVLRTICTPGHSADHACFWLESEGVLFSGDAVLARPLAPTPAAAAVFEDLGDYLASLTKLERLVPRLVFPGHGVVVMSPLDHIDAAKAEQRALGDSVLDLVRASPRGVVTTQDIVDACIAQRRGHGAGSGGTGTAQRDTLLATDGFVLSGTIRQHLLALEARGLIKRRPVAHDPFGAASSGGMDPTKIKGPGGLTMDQIFGKVQESRRQDWAAASGSSSGKSTPEFKPRGRVHPVHAGVRLGFDTAWSPA